jgi:hypothetical protein
MGLEASLARAPYHSTLQMRIGHENNAIFDQWLAGETTTEIAKKVDMPNQHIGRIIEYQRNSRLASALISETPPVYNVWPLQLL